uniref:uncharacterized protein LOC105352519 isoform X2 n=1 Tax=Fragaria vesca subsp. vesca TaxID=101020 RepID=UPI0005CA07F6|nr:PREDICTED: uncharacterized protein LOC105352519 isoform X2 [Fragaria vesca subsp. vesca]
MASKSIALFLVLVMATCSLQVLIIDVEAAAAAADCKFSNLGCFPAETAVSLMSSQNRKMVAGLKEQEDVLVGVELRKVPSGPDPLHHNGNAPKKPRADP